MAAWRRPSCLLDLRPLVNSRNLSDVSILNASICQSARSEFLQPYKKEIYKMKMNKKNWFQAHFRELEDCIYSRCSV